MGQNLRYGRPCTRDLPGTHNWRAQSNIASISSEIHWLSHAGTILEVWGYLLLHWLDSPHGLHPSACTSDFWTCPQTPPFTQITQKGCQSTGLELRIPMIYLNFRRSEGFGGGAKTLDPPGPPPHSPTPLIGPIYIPIDSSQDSE